MYQYQNERPFLFTEEGQVMFLKIRDNVKSILKVAGAVRMQEAISGITGSSWSMLACVDRLCELKEIIEIPNIHSRAGQYRIFISNKED
jgi:hypothetical protein